ncbi:MAG: hypothetical protein IPL73_20980 [Candidatus Obscuribacter sp.]|nr:hypothetical protein [Candidatus Obscuribacter sp.]
MTAKIGSDGFLAMGEQFAAQGAASIVELFVSVDLATDSTQPIVKLVTMSLADKWWIDQLVNNTVTLKVSTSSKVFLKQPDGTYTAPASSPGILTFTAGAYSLTTPQGVNYNFNTSGQISSFVTPRWCHRHVDIHVRIANQYQQRFGAHSDLELHQWCADFCE